jgi:hypothetical protein
MNYSHQNRYKYQSAQTKTITGINTETEKKYHQCLLLDFNSTLGPLSEG